MVVGGNQQPAAGAVGLPVEHHGMVVAHGVHGKDACVAHVLLVIGAQ